MGAVESKKVPIQIVSLLFLDQTEVNISSLYFAVFYGDSSSLHCLRGTPKVLL